MMIFEHFYHTNLRSRHETEGMLLRVVMVVVMVVVMQSVGSFDNIEAC